MRKLSIRCSNLKNYCFLLLVMAIFLLSSCQKDEKGLTSQKDLNFKKIAGGVSEYVEHVAMPASASFTKPGQQNVNKSSQITSLSSGCVDYPFTEGDWYIHNTYEDLLFSEENLGGFEVMGSWVQLEGTSAIYWYPTLLVLPETASSFSIEALDNENWEEWYNYYRTIGMNLVLYDEDKNVLVEYTTVTNSDWQYVTIDAPEGKLIKYVGFYPKYPVADPYTPSYMRWRNVTVCYQSCSRPEVSVNASQTEIWPPNNKVVTVEFSGTIANDCGNGEYMLIDEYGEISYSGILISHPLKTI